MCSLEYRAQIDPRRFDAAKGLDGVGDLDGRELEPLASRVTMKSALTLSAARATKQSSKSFQWRERQVRMSSPVIMHTRSVASEFSMADCMAFDPTAFAPIQNTSVNDLAEAQISVIPSRAATKSAAASSKMRQ